MIVMYIGLSEKRCTEYINNLNAILILLMVIGHFTEQCINGSGVAKSIFLFIYAFHMPLFLFIDGLTCQHILQNKKTVIAHSLYFFLLYVVYKVVIFFIKMISTGNASFELLTESGVPWYVFTLALYYPIAYLIKASSYAKRMFILIFSVVLALICGYCDAIGDFFVLSRSIVFFPFFLAGYYIEEAEKVSRFTGKLWIRVLGAYILLLVLFICFRSIDAFYFMRPIFTGRNSYKVLKESFYAGAAYRLLAYGISISMSIGIMAFTPRQNVKIFEKIGQKTLQIYFWHRPVLYVLVYCGVFKKLEQLAGWRGGRVIWLALGICLTFILSLDCFGKPLNWLYQILMPKHPKEK